MADKFVRSDVWAHYGLFMTAWSSLELIIEVAIAKHLNLDHLRGAIVTSGLGFQRKASILRSLLHLEDPKYQQAIDTLNKITNDARRNALVHGLILTSDDHVIFVKRDTDQKFKSSEHKFTPVEFRNHVTMINDMIVDLQALLDISEDEIDAFSMIGTNLISKSPTSPKPPSR